MNFTEFNEVLIITKSKNGVIARGNTYSAANTLPVIILQTAFSLLSIGRYIYCH